MDNPRENNLSPDLGLAGTRVLVVEDDELNSDMLCRRLSRRGCTVMFASTAGEAFDRAHEDPPPDVILMDLRLPDMSGWDAARTLKSDPQTRGIPLIALTAHAMEGDRARAINAGCDEYETKPIDLPRLIDKIQAVVHAGRPAPPAPEHPHSPFPDPPPR
jgi:two-component system cell cycle response regulator DivK